MGNAARDRDRAGNRDTVFVFLAVTPLRFPFLFLGRSSFPFLPPRRLLAGILMIPVAVRYDFCHSTRLISI